MITSIYNNLIWYSYNGDEIAWNGTHYLSLCSCGEFKSLDDLDEFWDSYYEVQREFYESEYNKSVVSREMAMDAGDLSLEGMVL